MASLEGVVFPHTNVLVRGFSDLDRAFRVPSACLRGRKGQRPMESVHGDSRIGTDVVEVRSPFDGAEANWISAATAEDVEAAVSDAAWFRCAVLSADVRVAAPTMSWRLPERSEEVAALTSAESASRSGGPLGGDTRDADVPLRARRRPGAGRAGSSSSGTPTRPRPDGWRWWGARAAARCWESPHQLPAQPCGHQVAPGDHSSARSVDVVSLTITRGPLAWSPT